MSTVVVVPTFISIIKFVKKFRKRIIHVIHTEQLWLFVSVLVLNVLVFLMPVCFTGFIAIDLLHLPGTTADAWDSVHFIS